MSLQLDGTIGVIGPVNEGFVTATGSTTPRNLDDRFADVVNVKDFGAVGDGVADDTAAIQAALDSQQSILLPTGTYRITSELVFKIGSKLIGQGNWSGVASTDIATGTSRILYDGPIATNSCVIRMSTQAVGITVPAGAGAALQNCALTNIVIDGNGKAEYGLYMVRSWSNNQLDYITVTGTTKHGFWAAKCWNGSPTNWMAYKNIGCGITIGANTFSWDSTTVDQSVCTSFFGYYSGVNSSTVYQNVFNTTSNSDKEYGIGIFGGRSLTMINAQAAECGGAGLYLSPEFRPVLFLGGYNEFNGKSSGNTSGNSWDIWLNSIAASWNITFNHFYLGGTPFIKLTGVEPSRIETGVIFERMPLLGTIDADWDNYRCIDSDRNVVFSSTKPNGFAKSINGNFNLSIAGMAVFDATAGSINLLQYEGIISSVTYTSVGTYEVLLSQTFSSARYGIIVQTGDNREASASAITTSGFTITNRTNNGLGTLTDGNARITVMVTGYYV
jgi:hypothetical protein